jgi:hypothetical protein
MFTLEFINTVHETDFHLITVFPKDAVGSNNTLDDLSHNEMELELSNDAVGVIGLLGRGTVK